MKSRRIGSIPVSEVGLGACLLSNEGRPGDAQAIATIHAALDAGVTLIDTADAYAISDADFGHNELLVRRALASYGSCASQVLVATKGGRAKVRRGGSTVIRTDSSGRAVTRSVVSAWTRSGSTSCTGPIPMCRTRRAWGPCATFSTRV